MRIRNLYPLLTLLAFCLIAPQLHATQQRQALVIGNASYTEGRLANPVNDARAIGRKLEQKGFAVTTLENAGKRQMEEAIQDFGASLTDNSIGLFYFAGHGLEVKGSNYLVPIGANIKSEADVPYEAVNAGRVLSSFQLANNGLNMLILDACRNNPYARGFRSATRGLSRMTPASGSLVLYATEPGNVAADGDGQNGLFTSQLLAAMDRPGLKIYDVFSQTAIQVNRKSGKSQTPYIEGVVLGDFYFTPPEPVAQLAGGNVSQVISSGGSDGALEINTRPSGASIDIDGVYSGLSPKRISDLKPGVHEVRASKAGHVAEQKRVRIARGETLKLTLLLDAETVEPSDYPLTIDTEPADARIRIINIKPKFQQGMTLADGRYHIEISAPGYHTHTEWIDHGGSASRLSVPLAPVSNDYSTNRYTEAVNGMTFVTIPGGSFQMGCGPQDGKCDDDEKPRHRVQVPAFALADKEVTLGQFRQFVEATGYRTEAEKDSNNGCAILTDGKWQWSAGKSWRSPGFRQGDQHPVVCVSWNDANAYIGWLKRESGEPYRLPSEAEWEYAARAGSTTRYHFGNDEDKLCQYANGGDLNLKEALSDWKFTIADCHDGAAHTAKVGSYRVNDHDLYDMHGNVWEWTEDCWNESYQGAPTDGDAWTSGECKLRVVRGGSWIDSPRDLRSANRDWGSTGYRFFNQGFRVARTLTP